VRPDNGHLGKAANDDRGLRFLMISGIYQGEHGEFVFTWREVHTSFVQG
jgi:hypothetical protein